MFDRKNQVQTLYKLKEYKNKRQCELADNYDFKQKYPDEIREFATTGKFTALKARVKKDHDKHIKQFIDRRKKIGQKARPE